MSPGNQRFHPEFINQNLNLTRFPRDLYVLYNLEALPSNTFHWAALYNGHSALLNSLLLSQMVTLHLVIKVIFLFSVLEMAFSGPLLTNTSLLPGDEPSRAVCLQRERKRN